MKNFIIILQCEGDLIYHSIQQIGMKSILKQPMLMSIL